MRLVNSPIAAPIKTVPSNNKKIAASISENLTGKSSLPTSVRIP